MSDNSFKVRTSIVAIFLMAMMIGLGIRLAFLHLSPRDEVRNKIEKNRRIEETIAAARGKIFDCNGKANVLALNLVLKDICADPSLIISSNKTREVAASLAPVIGLSVPEMELRLNKSESRFVYLQRFVEEEKAEAVRQLKLKGVFSRDSHVRYYPLGGFMCHVLGFVNLEGAGSLGIEQQMDKYLCGSPGYLEGKVDALRREIYTKREYDVPPMDGSNIELTIDQNIQYMVEKALDEAVVQHNPKGAWAIVQRIKTGEILAMASRPAFDLNNFRTAKDMEKLNRSISYVYEPGSTFKVIAFSAALNEGIVTPDTIFDCENGSWVYNRRALRDYHPYGRLTVTEGIQKSSNIMTAKIALMLGEKKLYSYLQAFNVGKKTGIDLPGEELGILQPLSKWSGISITRVPIGQGVAVTAIQMVSIFSAIANNGFLMRPYVVKSVTKNDGSLLYKSDPEVLSRPITEETARIMCRLLKGVTDEGGTGRRACVDGYEVAGKTGSAQKPVAGGYSSTGYMASFVGFLPANDPEITIMVVVDEPQPFHTGGVVAAPIFSKIANQTARYLDIPSSEIIASVKEKQRTSIARID